MVRRLTWNSFLWLALFMLPVLKSSGQGCTNLDFNFVRQGCPPTFKVTFNATGIDLKRPHATYWDFGDSVNGVPTGYQIAGDTTLKFYTAPGTYHIKLQVLFTDSNTTCTVDKPGALSVLGAAQIKFSADRTLACDTPYTFKLTDSTQNVLSRTWYINGTQLTDTGKVITHIFDNTASGLQDVTLEVINTDSCRYITTKKGFLKIPARVSADFCAYMTEKSPYKNVELTLKPNVDTSSTKVVSYLWTYTGGSDAVSASSSKKAVPPGPITYTNVDTLTPNDVTLKIVTKDGCTVSFTKKGLVMKHYSINKTSLCIKYDTSTLYFYSKTMGNASVSTSVQSNVKIVSNKVRKVTFLDFGTSNLNVGWSYPNSGCTDSLIVSSLFNVKAPKSDFESKDKAQCTPPDTVHFTNPTNLPTSGVNTYTWYFMDTVGVAAGNPATIIGKYGPYKDASNTLRDTAFIFKNFGVYSVALVTTNNLSGCKDSVAKLGIVKIANPVPYAVFINDTICLNDVAEAADSVQPVDDKTNPYKRLWVLFSQTNKNAVMTKTSKTFKNTIDTTMGLGVYDLAYSVVNGPCSNVDTMRNALTVFGVRAKIGVSKTKGCAPLTTAVTATITEKYPDTANLYIKYKWSVSPSIGVTIANDTLANTNITFNEKGLYTITCTLRDSIIGDSLFCVQSYSYNGTSIGIGTVAAFDIDKLPCKNISESVTDKSLNTPDKYLWDITLGKKSDVIIGPGNAPNFTFKKDGKYAIQLITQQNAGAACSDTAYDTVEVVTPTAKFDTNTITRRCFPQQVGFNSSLSSINKPGAIKYFSWDFNTDNPGKDIITNTSDSFPFYTFNKTNPLGYSVQLIVESTGGCKDTATKANMVKILGPVASFTMDKHRSCGEDIVTIVNTSQYLNNFSIDYRDGSKIDVGLGTGQVYKHVYHYRDITKDSNDYHPTLIAEGDDCYDFYSDTITLYRLPEAAIYSFDTARCAPYKAFLYGDSSRFEDTYNWDLDGDGVFGDDFFRNTSHLYTVPGKYTIGLALSNIKGCADTAYRDKYIHIYGSSTANFSWSTSTSNWYPKTDSICKIDMASFFDKSVASPGTKNIKWTWDFGDVSVSGDTSHITTPQYQYSDPGFHSVSLIVENDQGCSDTFTKDSVIYVFSPAPPPPPEIKVVSVDTTWTPLVKTDKNRISIKWDKANFDFSSYHLYRNDGTANVDILDEPNINVRSHIDNAASPHPDATAQSYTYSMDITTRCGDPSVLNTPHSTIFLDVKSTKSAENYLAWTPYKGWAGVKGYDIYRRNDTLGTYKKLASVTQYDTTYTDTTLCDSLYSYFVKATSASDSTLWSTSNVDTCSPIYIFQTGGINLVRTTVLNDKYTLTEWQQGQQTNIKGYIIDRYTNVNGWLTNYAYIPGNAPLRFIDTAVDVHQKSYTYRVSVEDKCGNVSIYGNVGKSILLTGSVVQIGSDPLDDARLFSWNPYIDWQSPDNLQGYVLQIKNRQGVYTSIYPFNDATDTTYQDTAVHSDIDSMTCYRVAAWRYRGGVSIDSSYSNEECVLLPARVFMPTAFSPDDNGVNDIFLPVSLTLYNFITNNELKYRFDVYNRWGVRVFRTEDVKVGWNGRINNTGAKVEQDVYVYVISAHGRDGRNFYVRGNVTILDPKNK